MQETQQKYNEALLSTELARLLSFTAELEEMTGEMKVMQQNFTPEEKGYFSSEEHDQIEHLLFRYLACRTSLNQMVEFNQDYEQRFPNDTHQAQSFLIGYSAALLLYTSSAELVHTFMLDPTVQRKLNEGYFRSEIPEGTYDLLFRAVTDPDTLKQEAAAWQIFQEELEVQESPLWHVKEKQSDYGALLSTIDKRHHALLKYRDEILEENSVLFPDLRNSLRHQSVTELARNSRQQFGAGMYAIRGLVMKNVSRLKRPGTPPLKFSADKLNAMKALMQPGDIILTFSEGYMSNIFLPGSFKHGITYIGSPKQRQALGLFEHQNSKTGKANTNFMQLKKQSEISGGFPADCIEAVAEGVIVNSVEKLAVDHFSRVVVLRPQISDSERLQQLETLFEFVGCPYDFKFDFDDATYQCCTELIYRCLNGIGAVKFKLYPRMGRQTLSADDICNYALSSKEKPFDFVLLAVEDEKQQGAIAKILTGSQGINTLRQLMKE